MAKEQNTDDEDLSIEEILSSIRDIISEDDDEALADAAKEQKAVPSKPQAEKVQKKQPVKEEVAAEREQKPEPEAEPEVADDINEDDDEEDEVLELKDPIEAGFADDEEDDDDEDDETEEIDTDMDEKENVVIPEEIFDIDEDFPAVEDDEALLSDNTKAASLEALAKLGRHVPVEDYNPEREGDVTLETITREMLRPMLKAWLDKNLPSVIERLVQKELTRITVRALDDKDE